MIVNISTTSLHDRMLNSQYQDKVGYYLDFLDASPYTIEKKLEQNLQNEENTENDPSLQTLFPCTGYTAVLSLTSFGNVEPGFYIMGDYSNLAFDLTTNLWQSLSPLPRFRTNHKAVKSKDYIWLFGGFSDESNSDKQKKLPVKEIDIYHILFDKWITISPSSPIFPFFWIHDDQQDIEIVEAFVLSDTKIYILTYNHNKHTNQMWMINSDDLLSQFHHQHSPAENIDQPTTTNNKNNAMIPREIMTIPRSVGVTLTPLMSRYVFAIGGNDYASKHITITTPSQNESQQQSYNIENNRVEVYDAKYNQWATLREPLLHSRSFATVLMFNDILYVFGGDQKTHASKFESTSSSWTERYDPHLGINGSWERVRTTFPSNKLSWDYVTLMASSQLQRWYLLTSQEIKSNEHSPSFLCQHKLYISQSPQQRPETAWTNIKHSIQDYMDNSKLQIHENENKFKGFILGAFMILCSLFIVILYSYHRRRRNQRQQTQMQIQEQSPLSISEFELA